MTERADTPKPPPPGGRAAERLRQFEQSRADPKTRETGGHGEAEPPTDQQPSGQDGAEDDSKDKPSSPA